MNIIVDKCPLLYSLANCILIIVDKCPLFYSLATCILIRVKIYHPYDFLQDDDIYDVMPANEKTVSDIGKLKNMFEQKPMAQYSSGKPFPQTKAFQPTGSPGNKPVVAEKPKVGVGKLLIPKEIQDKQKEIISPKNDSAPSLPSKNNRVSIVNGSIRQTSSQPALSKKSAPPPVAKKTKPTTPIRKEFPKAQPNDSNQNEVSKIESPKVDKPPEGSNNQPSSPRQKNDNGLNDGFDNNVKYIGETISAPNGNKYRMVECQSNPGPPPIKSRLPAKIDIDDIARKSGQMFVERQISK